MNKVWHKSLSKEQTANLIEAAGEGRYALERLNEVLKEYEKEAVTEMTRDKWYGGDWVAKQATLVAEVKVYNKIADLVNSLLTNR